MHFSQPTVSIKENVANAVITVVRGGGAGTAFTVTYTATPLTAVANVDFKPVTGTLAFAATTTSRQFSVPIINNSVLNGNRSVLLSLRRAHQRRPAGAQATATADDQDDEAPGRSSSDAGTYTILETAKVLPRQDPAHRRQPGRQRHRLLPDRGRHAPSTASATPGCRARSPSRAARRRERSTCRSSATSWSRRALRTFGVEAERAGQRRRADRAVHRHRDHHRGRPRRPDQVRRRQVLRDGRGQQRHAHGGAHAAARPAASRWISSPTTAPRSAAMAAAPTSRPGPAPQLRQRQHLGNHHHPDPPGRRPWKATRPSPSSS